MENRLMRITFVALLIGSIWIMQSSLRAEQTVVAVNTNFEPAKDSDLSQPTNPPPPQAAQPAQAPVPAPPQPATAHPATGSVVQQTAQEEIMRRKEAQYAAQQFTQEGMKLYYDGKYEAAIAKLEQAVKILPRAKATEVDYNRVVHGLTDSYYRLADIALQAADYAKAQQLANKALEYDPSNKAAQNVVVKAKQGQREVAVSAATPGAPQSGSRLDQTPEFNAKREEIKRLFREGKILMNSGQYDEAEKRFKQILLIDHYNDDAYTLLGQLDEARLASAVNAANNTRSLRLWQVTDSWAPAIGGEVKLPKPGEEPTAITSGGNQTRILRKLNDIIFPEISFREAVISDVVNFLSEESRRLDPDKIGVNIVLGAGVAGGASETAAAPTTPEQGQPAAPANPALTAGGGEGGRKITLNLRNVPMVDALRYITSLANLKFRVENSAVLILPLEAPEGQMVTRSYPVSPGAFKTLVSAPAGGAGGTSAANAGQQYVQLGGSAQTMTPETTEDIKKLFTDAGIQFPTGSSLVYNDRTSTIVIRNTPDNLESFERVLATFNVIPSQVEIEAKFIQISQTDLDELGFQWYVAGRQFGQFSAQGGQPTIPFGVDNAPPTSLNNITGGLRSSATIQGNAISTLLAAQGFGTLVTPNDQVATIQGILTNPQFQLIIQALSQKASSDLLSAPKITTISGAQAQVKVVQEFIYPTEFQQAQVVAAGGGTTGGGAVGVTPSIPSSFKTREVGVLLSVTPTVGADGYTINLTLIPEVSQFLGFINYGGPISVAAGNNVITTFNDIKQPLFSSQNLTTSIVIWDGQTVVLGGLITENVQKLDDKVPFLGDIPMIGRLFRSKTTVREKNNLLIFVTARLIDPAGNPIHREDSANLR